MKIFITGITGQAGSELAEFYLAKGYQVIGLIRRTSTQNNQRIAHLDKLTLVQGDITDLSSLVRILAEYKPDGIFHAAAQSQVRVSFDEPLHTFDVTGKGSLNLLEAIRLSSPKSKGVFFNSSEMFGSSKDSDGYQRETTPFLPVSPYGVAKLASHHLVNVYRKSYGLSVCSAIIFNMEGPRRGETFVTKKIVSWLAQFHKAQQLGLPWQKLKLGNINSYRDWQSVKDVCVAVDLMLGQTEDFVISSGETRSVRQFFQEALNLVEPSFKVDDVYEVDKNLFRPYELDYLRGDSSKIRRVLGWQPQVSFKELVREMVFSEIKDLMGEDYISDR